MKKKDFEKYEYFYTDDLPIVYKELKIYPIQVKDYFDFQIAMGCLMLDKDSIPDPKILSMSYLEYLLYLIELKNKEIEDSKSSNDDKDDFKDFNYLLASFYQVMIMCLKIDSIEFIKSPSNKPILRVYIAEKKEGLISKNKKYFDITRRDFDDIKDIILFQNLPNYDNEYINPEIKEEMESMNKIKNKDLEMPSFEMQKITLSLNSNYTLKEIDELTLRKFSLMGSQSDDIVNYKIYKQAELGGMVTFKQEVEHYLYKKKKNKFGDALLSFDAFKSKTKNALG